MTDPIRDLLISLSSHMAYMQGQLEARHELDNPEDYYWYRESVLLRQKVTDALADEPAVLEGREPATWTEGVCGDGAALLKDGVMVPIEAVVRELNEGARARAALADEPVAGEVAELVAWLREQADHELGSTFDADYFSEDPAARNLNRAADLLQRLSPPQPVPGQEVEG